jgi:hypothetical protein
MAIEVEVGKVLWLKITPCENSCTYHIADNKQRGVKKGEPSLQVHPRILIQTGTDINQS